MKKTRFFAFFLLALFLTALPAWAQSIQFDFGSADQWKLSGQAGRRLDKAEGVRGSVLEITGDGTYSNSWKSSAVKLIPSEEGKISTGRLRFKVRRTSGSGGGMTGFDFANYDIPVTSEWKTVTLTFIIPSGTTSSVIHLGQWMSQGTLQFAELEFFYVSPAFAPSGLGNHEDLIKDQKRYLFTSQWGKDCGNFNRTIESVKVSYNTDRWCFGGKSQLVYRFDAPQSLGGKFYTGALNFTIGYYVSGTLTAALSTDHKNWTELTSLNKSGSADARLPEFKDGVKTIWIRFQSVPKTNLQLHTMKFNASLDSATVGKKTSATSEPVKQEENSVRSAENGRTRFWELLEGDSGFPIPDESELSKKLPGQQIFEKTVQWTDAAGQARKAKIRCEYYVSDFYREDFGYRLGLGNDCPIWWCESTYKVTRKRNVPTGLSKPLELSAAKNDYESLQIVLRPETDRQLKSIAISDLKNAQGKKIDSKNIEIREVLYHFVENPTDYTGVRDFYPDALAPLSAPLKMSGGQNYPIFITVYVPEKTDSGLYSAELVLETEKNGNIKKSTFPIKLNVWNFSLPKKNHLETAFGYSPNTSWKYHGVTTNEDKRRINDLYFQLLSRYRISPYNPVPMAPYRVNFVVDKDHPEKSHAEIDFTDFDREMTEALAKYNFTGFSLPIQGMGGGTFQGRKGGSIKGFGEETVEYQAMFASETKQLQDHLEKKGWLDKAYIYWFDEPDAKDYEFVKGGMNRIKKYAPKLRTMLTEEPSDKVLEGSLLGKIDIWCPVTPNFNKDLAKICMDKNEIFWWYVCCWPHAPYCTEFTDHNAVELRTWLWQTWKYNVSGILVWASNFWTSPTAFPKSWQNPYLDPMCYVSSSTLAPGTKHFWGNGDGRFYYPPLACAQPSEKPNFEAPVPSIRLEMLREGLEDYEMLYLLREKLTANKTLDPAKRAEFEKLLIVPEEITSSMTVFSTSPQPIYQHRAKVAQAIEALEK